MLPYSSVLFSTSKHAQIAIPNILHVPHPPTFFLSLTSHSCLICQRLSVKNCLIFTRLYLEWSCYFIHFPSFSLLSKRFELWNLNMKFLLRLTSYLDLILLKFLIFHSVLRISKILSSFWAIDMLFLTDYHIFSRMFHKYLKIMLNLLICQCCLSWLLLSSLNWGLS